MKKALASFLVGVTVIGLGIGTKSVYASEATEGISGGWSESTGYYQNENISTKSNGISLLAASSPSSHKGKRLSRVYDNSGDIEVASYGETIWKDKYHYTTARTEDRKGNVNTTSGRQYGIGYTNATSPYYRPGAWENVECRTYWGDK